MWDLNQSVGARSPYRCDYKIGVNKNGRIESLDLKIVNNHVSPLTQLHLSCFLINCDANLRINQSIFDEYTDLLSVSI